MTPCLSQAVTLSTPFAGDIVGYAGGGCHAVEVWLTKLETHLESHSPESTEELLQSHGTKLLAAAFQGGLLLSQGEAREAHFAHFKKRLELCERFRIPTLVVVADFHQRLDATALPRSIVSLTQAAQWADGYGVKLALEFQGGNTFCSCLDTAITLVEQCGQPNLGVCLDLFHFYTGPSKSEDLVRLTAATLAHVQLCDVPGVPRELMTDADRVFPGEGDFVTHDLVRHLHAIQYAGAVSLEVLNPVLWEMKPSQLAELAMTSLKTTLGVGG